MAVRPLPSAELEAVHNQLAEALGASRLGRRAGPATLDIQLYTALSARLESTPEYFTDTWTQKAYSELINSNSITLPVPVE